MQTVELNETITFTKSFSDGAGNLVDPPEVTFTVYRVVNLPTFGPLYYNSGNGEVERVSEGNYKVTLTIHPQMLPGIYTAEWQGLVDGNGVFDRSEFQILERSYTPSTILDPPTLYGTMKPSPSFNMMGLGTTLQLCIVGHCSGLTINEPHQVEDIQETINLIGANQYSPMVRALLEAYNAGSRDIWIMPAAPESEYVTWDPNNPGERLEPRPEFGGENFYEYYKPAFDDAMDKLAEYEFPDIVVAPDAPLYNTGGIDFLTPLVQSCVNGFLTSGRFRFGFIGTLMGNGFIESDLEAIKTDSRLDSYGQDGKTICVIHGEGTINTPNVGSGYSHSVATIAAATTAALPFEESLTYKNLRGVVSPSNRPLKKDEIKELANAKINSLTRTSKGRRGEPYNSVMATDNLLAENGSDFWSLPQLKVVQEVIKTVRALGHRRLGTIAIRSFEDDVVSYLTNLVLLNKIRDYKLSIRIKPETMYTLTVDIVLKPYFSVREIVFSVEVGAGATGDNAQRNTL